jgi:acyl carrier protein
MKGILDSRAQSEAKEIIRKFIIEGFLPSSGLDTLEDDDSFMEKGIIDSTGVLELLEFLEGKFEIKIGDEEVIPDNLDSLNKLCAFIERKSEQAGR